MSLSRKQMQRQVIRFIQPLVLSATRFFMVLTRLRNGRISNLPEEVEYWMPDFVIPDNVKCDLLNRFHQKNDVELAVLQDNERKIIRLVDEKIDRQQFIRLELNESIVLETRLKNGRISFEKNDVVRYQNLQVPEHIRLKLQKDFATTRNAKLFVISDSEGNLRTIVQVGTFQYLKGHVKKKIKNI